MIHITDHDDELLTVQFNHYVPVIVKGNVESIRVLHSENDRDNWYSYEFSINGRMEGEQIYYPSLRYGRRKTVV